MLTGAESAAGTMKRLRALGVSLAITRCAASDYPQFRIDLVWVPAGFRRRVGRNQGTVGEDGMPTTLDRTDRSILIGAGILVVLLAIATSVLTPSRRSGRTGFPSTYSTTWDGGKAAYLLLNELGYDVQRWDHAPTELAGDPKSQVLLLANPLQPATAEETVALRRFLEQGGRIVATGDDVYEFLPEGQKFTEMDDAEGETRFPALLPSPLTVGAPEISLPPPVDWHPARVDQIAVYGNSDTAAVVTYSVGKGTIVWWGSPSPLTNRGIPEPGNLALLLNSIGERKGKANSLGRVFSRRAWGFLVLRWQDAASLGVRAAWRAVYLRFADLFAAIWHDSNAKEGLSSLTPRVCGYAR